MLSNNRTLRLAGRYVLTILLLVIFLFPVYWLGLSSLKTKGQLYATPPVFFFNPTLDAYGDIWHSYFPRAFINSLVVAISSVLLSLSLGVPAAYALSRFRFRGRRQIKVWIISTRMAPPFGFIIPLYLIFRNLHLLDTYIALTIMYMTFNLSFTVWLLISFFSDVPSDIVEAAMVDGCSETKAFMTIVLPLVKPGIAATLLLSFVYSWREFLFASVLTGGRTTTIPVEIASRIGLYDIQWNEMCAMSVVSMVPMFLIALLIQKSLVRGLTMGAIKG